ncbi:MAG: helix-turn-helix domain-containing protein [Rhizomicrobium sp.]
MVKQFPGIYRFSSDSVPERDRRGFWREVVARQYLGMDSDPLPDVPFFVDMNARELPGLTIGGVMLCGTQERRTRETLADGKADFAFNLNFHGEYLISYRGQEQTIRPGEAMLQSMGETGCYARPVLGGGIGLRLPRPTLSELVPQLDELVARPVDASNPALLLLDEYATAVNRMDPSADISLQRAAVSHVFELVALTLRSAFGVRVEATRRGLRAAMLHRVKQDISRNLHNPRLSLGHIAERNGLTPRSVQRLFAQEQTSFSEFVMAKRLERVFDRLRDPQWNATTVTVLALECGFSDMSTFYRFFRRRFGATPLDVRNNTRLPARPPR